MNIRSLKALIEVLNLKMIFKFVTLQESPNKVLETLLKLSTDSTLSIKTLTVLDYLIQNDKRTKECMFKHHLELFVTTEQPTKEARMQLIAIFDSWYAKYKDKDNGDIFEICNNHLKRERCKTLDSVHVSRINGYLQQLKSYMKLLDPKNHDMEILISMRPLYRTLSTKSIPMLSKYPSCSHLLSQCKQTTIACELIAPSFFYLNVDDVAPSDQ